MTPSNKGWPSDPSLFRHLLQEGSENAAAQLY